MALLDKKTTAAAFESDDNDAATAAPAPAAVPAVPAVQAPRAVTVASPMSLDAFSDIKGALPVEYNTLTSIKATNGNFVERETSTVLGDQVVFDLLSFQDAYVVSANDDKADKDTLSFSNDGVTCTDGRSVADAVAELREMGWSKAGVKHRLTVVGAVQSASKTDKLNGALAQFDLSPESRVLFQRYQATAAYGIRVGKLTKDKALQIKATTRLVTKGNNTYTVVDFVTA